MTQIEVGGVLYPAQVEGWYRDPAWDHRDSKAITLAMTYDQAKKAFPENVTWFLVWDPEPGTQGKREIYDNSDYCVAGPITDNRNGTVTVKMGKPTEGEQLRELLEVLNT